MRDWQRDVAIKSLSPEFTEDEERLARFRRESRIIAQLNHPHIAQIYHLLEQEGQVHLVLEYVPGRSLAEMIERGGALDLETALGVCTQIALAMEAVHARDIVHRDLKPANIRVTDDGTTKVLDFGVARFSPSGEDAASAAIEGSDESAIGRTMLAGTPGYMAPEQAEGDRVDARADIFSFGCILYECLTGQPAFPGTTSADRIAVTLTAEPDWSQLPVELPDGVHRLLVKCLTKNVVDRLQRISEARAVLDAAIDRHLTPTPHAESGSRIADNLPAITTSFVGRFKQLEELSRLLSETRLLTLTGVGGAGKTRLAVELCAE